MAETRDQIKGLYPLPVYNYRVTFNLDNDSVTLGFSEVSGLTLEYEPITYKHGLSFIAGSTIMPGMRQPITLTLKRGLVPNIDFLLAWINEAAADPGGPNVLRDVTIDLCDEEGKPVVRWRLLSALPTKLEAPTFDANANEVAIESMELVAHNLIIEQDL